MKSPGGKAVNVSDQNDERQVKIHFTNLKGYLQFQYFLKIRILL